MVSARTACWIHPLRKSATSGRRGWRRTPRAVRGRLHFRAHLSQSPDMTDTEEVLFRCPGFAELMAELDEQADLPELCDVPAGSLIFEPIPARSGLPGEVAG